MFELGQQFNYFCFSIYKDEEDSAEGIVNDNQSKNQLQNKQAKLGMKKTQGRGMIDRNKKLPTLKATANESQQQRAELQVK